jgi:hypothetical protein
MAVALVGGLTVLYAKLSSEIPIPGYAATVLTVMFFGGLSALGLGTVGQYLWLCLQNTRGRPSFLVDTIYANDREKKAE